MHLSKNFKIYEDLGSRQEPECKRGNSTLVKLAEIDLSGSTACAFFTVSILYPLVTLSLSDAVVTGRVGGSCVHVDHRVVHFMIL